MDENIRILLVRHAESEGNVDPSMYIKKGDSNVSLTDLGWQQAFGTGNFLSQYYGEGSNAEWPEIFLSSYQRPLATFSAIHHCLKNHFLGRPQLKEDVRLIEKFFGAASALEFSDKKLSPDVLQALKTLAEDVYSNDKFSAAHLFGESTLDTHVRVKTFIDGTLRRDIKERKNDFLIVSHGAVLQSFIMNWFHLPMRSKGELGNPNNGDVIEIKGSPKNWTVTKIYDGKEMKPVDTNLIKNIKHLTVDTLPEIPQHILSQLKLDI